MKTWKLALLLLAAIIAVPAACILIDQLSTGTGDSVVFLEYKNNTRGQLVYGNYTGKILDGEEYAYDAENSLLTCAGNLDINGSLKALVGTTQSLMQDAGNGISTSIAGVYSCPGTADRLKIDTVFDDGTVVVTFNGSTIKLAPGQRWVRVYTENVETDDYRLKLTNTEIIRNNGKISRSSIGL